MLHQLNNVDPIEELVGAICDPIIVYPSQWAQDLPERLKEELPIHRLAHVKRCLEGEASWDEVCDLEALLYLYPRSLESPLGETWTNIYLYLGTKAMGNVSEEVKVKTLTSYQESELRELKRWIRSQKLKSRKGERHQDKSKESKIIPIEAEQLKMF